VSRQHAVSSADGDVDRITTTQPAALQYRFAITTRFDEPQEQNGSTEEDVMT